MLITVRAVGTLMNHMPEMAETMRLEFPGPISVGEVIAHLGLPDYAIWIMTINGEKVETNDLLNDGDLFSLFAPVAGG